MIPVCIDLETRPAFVHESQLEALARTSKKNPKRTDETRAEWAAADAAARAAKDARAFKNVWAAARQALVAALEAAP